MKPKSSVCGLFLRSVTLATIALAGAPAYAASIYWDGGTVNIAGDGDGISAGGLGNWNTTLTNWDAGVAPHVAWINANNDTAVFGGTGGTVTAAAVTVGGINFLSNGYTINTGPITFGTSGAIDIGTGNSAIFGAVMSGDALAAITKTGEGQITFNNAANTFAGQLTVADGTLRVTAGGANVSANSRLGNSALPVTLGSTGKTGTLFIDSTTAQSGSKPFALASGGSGRFQTSSNAAGIQTISGEISGDGNLIKTGAANLILSAATNSYTGTTTINGGPLQFNTAASIGGTGRSVTVANGAMVTVGYAIDNAFLNRLVENSNAFNIGVGLTSANNLDLSSSTGATLPNATLAAVGALDVTYSGVLTPGGNTYRLSCLATGGNNGFTLSNALTGATNSLVAAAGFGRPVALSAAPTYGGTTTVQTGAFLNLLGVSISGMGGGVGVRDITVQAGASIRRNSLDNAFLNRIVESSDEFTVMTGSTSNAFDFGSSTGANLPNAFLASWAGNGAKTELSGVITPGGGAYRLASSAQGGTLGIRQESLLSGSNQLIIGGNRVVLVGAHTFTGDTTIRNGGRFGLAAFTGGTNSLGLQNSALDLGAPSATGQFFLEAGSTAGPITGSNLGVPASSGLGTLSATFGGLKGSRNLHAAYIAGVTGNNTSGTAQANITGFTLNVGTGNTHTYSGSIGGFGVGAASGTGGASTLTKSGLGAQILEGVNTYTGATSISGGTLGLGTTGSIATSASVSIAAGGTLDTSGQATYAIPTGKPVTFGVDATESGSSGRITAATLDISNATVTYDITGPLDDAVYVLATYTGLAGANFLSAPADPVGYTLDYDYEGNKIALVSNASGSAYDTWKTANAPGSNPTDDTDGDGVSNALEFVLGGTSATKDLDKLPVGTTSGGNMTFTFKRDVDSIDPKTALFIEINTDLATWNTSPSPYIVPDTAVANNPGVTVVEDTPAGFDTVTLTVPQAPDAKKFARVKVVITP